MAWRPLQEDDERHLMSALIDRAGQQFGRLHVLRVESRNGESWAICWCECGNRKEARSNALGRTIFSCGCLRRDYRRSQWLKHGESTNGGGDTPEYRAWINMKRRCIDPAKRHIYADRGITVCSQWLASFPAFLAHVGRRPSPDHSIDRWPNNAGNYEPENVRWATRSQQAKNRRQRVRAVGRFQ